MTPETAARPPRRGRRFLRGLSVQLLLWTILPLGVVLVALSLAGVTRHRQAMTRLVEDRDRGLTAAEANRLGREIAQETAGLARLAATLPATTADSAAPSLLEDPAGSVRSGLALRDARGALLAASPAAAAWADSDAAAILAARTIATGQPQYETDVPKLGAARLLIAVPDGGSQALIAALPVEALSPSESGLLMEGEHQGTMLVLDQTGRPLHHHDPAGLISDAGAFADVPSGGSGSTCVRDRSGGELLVSYAAVEPPG